MAFQSASGHNNLPNGNFSSIIYSKKVQLGFRKATVVGDISNSDYFGEISSQGDTVKIIKEPEISVQAYARGTTINPQDLDDEDYSLVVDKANYFAFKIDDIEEAHSHVNFMQLAVDRAAYRLADQFDQDVLGYLSGYKQAAIHSQANALNDTARGTKAVTTAGSNELLASMQLNKGNFGNITTSSAGDHSIPLAARLPGATALPTATASPAMVVARMKRLMDQQQVDTLTNFGVIVAGHDSAIATAEQINKTETYRDPDSFADIVRGMQVYGSKILRPEAIVTAKYNAA